ncbi:MAG: efflux RND transporter periplasmic adaptor subunit [Xanthomonadales bacterium]|nr:Macrolide export protein MacA [Xanthomonadales bacterium]MCC6592732.1 efflux RND transporter periplasmic adaptor subunit [Xanthomonadales bacterium]MCE7932564.1 efflux RND transporter periplasmic adaptor subunit [Xanthomonadales bacterium PRO6]
MSHNDLLGQLRIDRDARPETPPARAGVPWWLFLGTLALVTAAGWWFLGRTPAPVAVRTVTARAAASAPTQASVLDASGYVVARRQATVSAKVTGKVREVLIEEGMRVEEGQVLATLDDVQQRAEVALYEAQLGGARSVLAEIEANLRQAQADYVRQQEIHARKLGTAAQLDAARAAAESLAARLASQRRQVKVAEESLALSKVSLDDTVVRAPFAGVVIAKAAQPGEMISPISAGGGFTRTGIGTIVDMDSLEVEVDVNEAFIGRVQARMPVEATLNAYPDWKIPGSVIAVIPAADRSRATVRVRVALAVEDPRIVPDMGVRVRFLEARGAQSAEEQPKLSGVLVPQAALVEEAGKSFVYVVENGRASRREVSVGAAVGDSRNLTAGVVAGQTVVVSPPAELVDGVAVAAAEN